MVNKAMGRCQQDALSRPCVGSILILILDLQLRWLGEISLMSKGWFYLHRPRAFGLQSCSQNHSLVPFDENTTGPSASIDHNYLKKVDLLAVFASFFSLASASRRANT